MLWLIYCSVRRRTNKFSFDLSFSSNQLYELIERKIPNILALLHLHTVVFFSLASYFMPVQPPLASGTFWNIVPEWLHAQNTQFKLDHFIYTNVSP